jgi:hypothetical protein
MGIGGRRRATEMTIMRKAKVDAERECEARIFLNL